MMDSFDKNKECLCGRDSSKTSGIVLVYHGQEITLCDECLEKIKQPYDDFVIYGEVFLPCQ